MSFAPAPPQFATEVIFGEVESFLRDEVKIGDAQGPGPLVLQPVIAGTGETVEDQKHIPLVVICSGGVDGSCQLELGQSGRIEVCEVLAGVEAGGEPTADWTLWTKLGHDDPVEAGREGEEGLTNERVAAGEPALTLTGKDVAEESIGFGGERLFAEDGGGVGCFVERGVEALGVFGGPQLMALSGALAAGDGLPIRMGVKSCGVLRDDDGTNDPRFGS